MNIGKIVVLVLFVLGSLAYPITTFAHERNTSFEIIVDKSEQRMRVVHNGELLHTWKVSTGKKSSYTPTGTFGIQSLSADHFSSIYDNAPMPWSIFYDGNRAIHGVPNVSNIGNPSSMGCTHLEPENAERLFTLVQEVGLSNVRIIIES